MRGSDRQLFSYTVQKRSVLAPPHLVFEVATYIYEESRSLKMVRVLFFGIIVVIIDPIA